MALRGIQGCTTVLPETLTILPESKTRQYIFASPEKDPSNTIIIIIIYIGVCVSSYYLTIVSDCQLPFCLFTTSAGEVRSSSGNIQVAYYCPGVMFLNMRRFTSIT